MPLRSHVHLNLDESVSFMRNYSESGKKNKENRTYSGNIPDEIYIDEIATAGWLPTVGYHCFYPHDGT